MFRKLVELVTLLAYEATRGVRVGDVEIETPVTSTTGVKLAQPAPLVVPILRAGLGMLDGMMKMLPTAEVGFLGMIRDEETHEPTTYAERLPKDLSGRQCYVLDPMLATGGLSWAAPSSSSSSAAPTTSPPSCCSPPPRASRSSRAC